MGKAKSSSTSRVSTRSAPPEMQAILSAKAGEIPAEQAPDSHQESKAGPKTAVARVWPNSKEGMRAEAKNGALSKAVGGWGGGK